MIDGGPSGVSGAGDALERRLAALSPAKRALFLKQMGLAPPVSQSDAIPRVETAGPVPLSYGQELLWLVEQATAGAAAYNVHSGLRLRGSLSEDALRHALDALVTRHEVLRSRFPVVDGAPMQVVDPDGRPTLETIDFRSSPIARRDAEARAWVRALARRPFDLETELPFRAGLARIADDEWWLVLSRHHLVSDGWSQGVLYSDMSALYTAFATGKQPDLAPLQVQYRDYAVWQRDQLQGERLERLLKFWRAQVTDAADQVSLPTDFSRPRTPSFEGRWVSTKYPIALRDAIKALGREQNASMFVTLLAAFQAFIHRYASAPDVVVASPVAGRAQPELAPLIGYFGNTLLLRADFADDPSFRGLLGRVRETAMSAFDHQELPFERLVLDLPPERRAGELFHAIFSFNTGIYAPPTFADLAVSAIGEGIGAAKTDLVLSMAETADGLAVSAEYRVDLFERATIERFLANFQAMLGDIVAHPDAPVSRLAVMTEAERQAVVHQWNDTDAVWPTDATLHGLFEAQVAQRPDATAVQCAGITLTYADLDRRANRLARRLRASGVTPNTLVAVCMEKSADLVAVLLGILKAGGAYVPMDPHYPDDRIAFMIDDSAVQIAVIDASLVPRLSRLPTGRRVEFLTAADGLSGAATGSKGAPNDGQSDALQASAGPTDLCYVIYTSGSTGRPKGVLIEHRNVVRLLFNDRFQFRFDERDVWTAFHSFSFDFSVWEMYGALLYGGRLVVVPRDIAQQPAAFLALLATERVTVLNQVPSAFYALMEQEFTRASATLSAIRYVIFGGEALQPALLRDWKGRYPATTLVNMFGITETTVHVTFKEIGAAEIENGASNIGGPIPTLGLYVLDAHLQPVPIGVTGELCVGGAGVARAYLGRPELTAERFVAHPFKAGERMYRSGDLGRRRADGEVEYLGRRDAQVKIRGFRIEPGEVETVLAGHPAVVHAAVVAITTQTDGTQLAGYYVPAGTQITPASLRSYLRDRLPEYMIPAFLLPIDAIPLTANGKVDRAALPSPQAAGAPSSTYAPARTTPEHQLVHIWKKLLDTRPIGIHDNFFDLGGHSLLAIRMLAEVEQMSGRRLPLASLFEDGTIERLAARIESAVHEHAEPPVVVLPSDADARPFIFLHGDVRGGGWYCRRLAQLIGPGVKMVVLPTLGPGTSGTPLTIEAMAAHHLTEVRRVQPTGPYRLGGYCLGGVIAFEMGQQLLAAGERVDSMILVNTGLRNPPYRGLRASIDVVLPAGADAAYLDRRATWLNRVVAIKSMKPAQRWHWLRRNIARRLPWSSNRTVPVPSQSPGPLAEFWKRPGSEVLAFHSRASSAYIPRPCSGPIDLIIAVQRSEAMDVDPTAGSAESDTPKRKLSRRGWQRVSPDVRVVPIQATHVGLITDQLETLAEHLRGLLTVQG